MKTILISAYAVNPFKGSEDGMGWNYISQAAVNHRVVAVTRHNNRQDIERYIAAHTGTADWMERISFLYFDWPQWTLFWKKGPMLSMIYYYLWQLSLAFWLVKQKVSCDIVHNLNFHNDWTPSFLWMLNRKFVWGPVGHHPAVPLTFLWRYGWREVIKDRAIWIMKWCFWNLDPLLALTRYNADAVWCMHDAAADRLRLKERYVTHPSVAAAPVVADKAVRHDFTVLSIGRFVPLKGFDVTVKAFAAFYRTLDNDAKKKTVLKIIGKGPWKSKISRIAEEEGVAHAVEIIDWMPQAELGRLYRDASVFLFPSHEGAGMVVPEALRYGIPVLCWDNIGPGSIVHPESQLKVPYSGYRNSVHTFSRRLLRLYRDSSFYARESALAYARFSSSLSWDVKAQQLDTFYESENTLITF